jgi:hypothetical protein
MSFFFSKLQQEVAWESLQIATDSLIESLGRYAVERGEVFIQKHALSANDADCLNKVDFVGHVTNVHDARCTPQARFTPMQLVTR